MPWFRLDDAFDTHPKVLAAGNEAIGLYIRCGTYAARNLTDGFVSKDVALLYGSPALADTLVSVKLWHRTRGGWRIHDYLDYNPSREDVIHKREVRAEAGRKGGVQSGIARSSSGNNGSKNEANASPVASHMDEPPSRSRPGVPVVDVVNRGNGSSGTSAAVIDAIMKEIHDQTGRVIDDSWAHLIAVDILDGRSVASPAAYVRNAIRNEPDPAKRFLPRSEPGYARHARKDNPS